MLDADGFRPNVGIILSNHEGRLLWTRRLGGQDAWQFPQGGIDRDESAEQALFRELTEEVGLEQKHVRILGVTKGWLRYRLPRKLIRRKEPQCIGQKQKWFLLELVAEESAIDLNATSKPEFDTWDWVTWWYPLSKVVSFKREVYRKALKELSPFYHRRFGELKFPPSDMQSCNTTTEASQGDNHHGPRSDKDRDERARSRRRGGRDKRVGQRKGRGHGDAPKGVSV